MKSSELEEKIKEWDNAVMKILIDINEIKSEGDMMLPQIPCSAFMREFSKMTAKARKALNLANHGTYDYTKVRM